VRRIRWIALLGLICFAGCFPIELDVNKDGKLLVAREEGFFLFDPTTGKVDKIAGADNGKPVFGRFSPNGKDVLLVSADPAGFNAFNFVETPLTGGKGREVFKGENTAYVRYSPDGASLAICQGSEKEDPELKDKFLELKLVALKGSGEPKVLARRVAASCRWFADSKQLLIGELTNEGQEQQLSG
jgi:hypothetical protein